MAYIVATAQHLAASLATLRMYWATPEALIPYWRHVAIILFDHVPQAIKRLDESMIEELD